MQTKQIFKVSMATLFLGILAGCQAVEEAAQVQVTPVGQSTSTVQIVNRTDFGEAQTQEKLIKPFDGSLPQADIDAFEKADASKNPQLCDAITTEAYRKFCIQQAGDKNAPTLPLQYLTPTQENCKSTSDDKTTGAINCVNYEE